MREILFRDLTENSRKRRLLSVQERFNQSGCVYLAERKTFYKLKAMRSFNNIAAASEWVNRKMASPAVRRQMSFLRICNKKTGQNMWRSKVTGRLYILHNRSVLTFLFIQMAKVSVRK